MLRFFKEQCLGIEITSSALKVGLLSGRGAAKTVLHSKSAPLATGMVTETFSAPQVRDSAGLSEVLRAVVQDLGARSIRRAGLSLPDGTFRIQTLEFDDLPKQRRDRDKLVRWRLEKGAAFEVAGTILRYQAYSRGDRGSTVLACVAKQDSIAQYEDLLRGLGLEPWFVAPSSLNAMNVYSPYLAGMDCSRFAFVWVAEGSSATIIMDEDVPRFYRYKEIKTGGAPADVTMRLIRDLDDSLHFYVHMDRQQQAEVGHLFLAGDPAATAPLLEGLKSETALAVEQLVPGAVLASAEEVAPSMAAAFGAAGGLA